jgi:hypothetical protein
VTGRGCVEGWQVSPEGELAVESGTGARGTSRVTLSGGKPLGPDGARRLAELLRNAPPPLLVALDLRHVTTVLPPSQLFILFSRRQVSL